MFDFEKPRIEIAEISEDKKYGRFVVEPLERGYGTTLGNSLRRIMLSSLPGAAVSQVKIDGVLHEFSSRSCSSLGKRSCPIYNLRHFAKVAVSAINSSSSSSVRTMPTSALPVKFTPF